METAIKVTAIVAIVGVALMTIAVIDAFANLLRSVARHRDAQADSVLHHAGLLEQDTEGDD